MTDLPRSLHARAVADWIALVEQVPADAWEAPTPCAHWSVRQLVNHVTSEELWAAELVRGATLEEVGDRYDGDVLGDDPVGAVRAAAAADLAALEQDVVDTVHLSYGDERVEEYLGQLTADHVVHGWDLAAGAGLDRQIPEESVNAVAGWFGEREDAYRSAGVIGSRKESDGSPQGQLLAAFGRRADWSPPPQG